MAIFKSADFERVPGAARQYKNKSTGEVISRRKYLELKRGVTLEEFAQLNKQTNPELYAARPARGRTSAVKKSPTERAIIAEARLEDMQRRKDIANKNKLMAAKTRKVRTRKFRLDMLKAGRQAVRISFNDYDEYVTLFKDAKATGKVLSYGLGIIGFMENGYDVDDRGITVFHLRAFDKLIPEDEFNERMTDELEARSYFVFSHFYMHVHFKKEYWLAKAQRAKARSAKKRSLF
jgi:hypothetical protein